MYNEIFDEEFIKWLRAENTASVKKLMNCVISKYKYLHQNAVEKKSADNQPTNMLS